MFENALIEDVGDLRTSSYASAWLPSIRRQMLHTARINLSRLPIAVALVGTLLIIILKVRTNPLPGHSRVLVILQVRIFIFHAAPQALNEMGLHESLADSGFFQDNLFLLGE